MGSDRLARRSVSVIIPSRDGRSTIGRALDSLVPNAGYIGEVLIVLSNSPHIFHELCAILVNQYKEHFPIHVLDSGMQSNGSIARNCGIREASSEFVAFLDDDDEWMPRKLEAYLDFVLQRKLVGRFVLFSTAIVCHEDRTQARLCPAIPYGTQEIVEFILSFNGGAQTSTLMLPAPLAKQVQFDASLPRHQDYDFCMRLVEADATFYALAQPLSFWYQRGNSVEKGATFDYCRDWVNQNQHRLSRGAYIGYLEKELFAAARNSGRIADFWRVVLEQLGPMEQLATARRLGVRAVRRAVKWAMYGDRMPNASQLLSRLEHENRQASS